MKCFCRFALDLGVPVVSMHSILKTVSEMSGKSNEFAHSFFTKAKDMIDAKDHEKMIKERLHLKLLRLSEEA
jgi:hypothetical protein